MRTLIIIFFALVKQVSGQSGPLSLEEKIGKAELIFEGRVIADSAFTAYKGSMVYTAEFVLISKEFKGNFASDTMMVIIRGGMAGGVWQETIDGGTSYLRKGAEGIFICTHVDPNVFSGIEKNTAYWATTKYLYDGFININCDNKLPAKTHRAYCSDGTVFEDVEKELYQPIEQITGKKYKKLRLNCLEQNNPRK